MRKAFICPTKYVQGEDEILNLGYFVKTFGESALLIAHPDDVNRVREKLERTAEKFQIQFYRKWILRTMFQNRSIQTSGTCEAVELYLYHRSWRRKKQSIRQNA